MIIISLDIGLKRIGVAFATHFTPPVVCAPILRKNRVQASNDVKKILQEKMVDTLIIGIPKGGASEEEMRRRIEHFVSLLNFNGKIEFQDEYGTSIEATKLTGTLKDGKTDSVAALLILQRWLEKQ